MTKVPVSQMLGYINTSIRVLTVSLFMNRGASADEAAKKVRLALEQVAKDADRSEPKPT